ncbi:hypothetical protein BOS5A_230427 [Bosea sp. EC-HK365B]|nr:hypothetical protein BOSE21B_90504 [Bosea sp. 21B]CAD5297232.1 hypothetical protein BOSE7B_60161 [Bosea sp. 7B]VVT61150.1 hypothetical protein BOS5A_230427 [Bosea sp. EC-HK365B]VXB16720.1 hypothetical protein BOSE125_130115 [Bosea sp. 125]VXB26666.1 hypothetical protein BOSE127_110160 [Bosea sp. 127]
MSRAESPAFACRRHAIAVTIAVNAGCSGFSESRMLSYEIAGRLRMKAESVSHLGVRAGSMRKTGSHFFASCSGATT